MRAPIWGHRCGSDDATLARAGPPTRRPRKPGRGATSAARKGSTMAVRKWGGETLVNTDVTGQQFGSSVATLQDGSYVISWTDVDAAGGDGSESSVKFQHYD